MNLRNTLGLRLSLDPSTLRTGTVEKNMQHLKNMGKVPGLGPLLEPGPPKKLATARTFYSWGVQFP